MGALALEATLCCADQLVGDPVAESVVDVSERTVDDDGRSARARLLDELMSGERTS